MRIKKYHPRLNIVYVFLLFKLNMPISVTRKAHFNAAHRLHNPLWDDVKNREVFGLCNLPNYHGHNYDLEITVTGEINVDSGFVIDLKYLKDLIKENVEKRFDHKNLNLDTVEFANLNPTAENIAVVIWNIMRNVLDPKLSLQVTLFETERNFVTYSG